MKRLQDINWEKFAKELDTTAYKLRGIFHSNIKLLEDDTIDDEADRLRRAIRTALEKWEMISGASKSIGANNLKGEVQRQIGIRDYCENRYFWWFLFHLKIWIKLSQILVKNQKSDRTASQVPFFWWPKIYRSRR